MPGPVAARRGRYRHHNNLWQRTQALTGVSAQLSDREVERLLSSLEVKAFASRDEQEVAGYADVMETIFAHAEAIDLTENHIKQLHRELRKYSAKDNRHRGAYKTFPNHVAAFWPDGKSLGIVFETATPFETPRLMAELVKWAPTSSAASYPANTFAL